MRSWQKVLCHNLCCLVSAFYELGGSPDLLDAGTAALGQERPKAWFRNIPPRARWTGPRKLGRRPVQQPFPGQLAPMRAKPVPSYCLSSRVRGALYRLLALVSLGKIGSVHVMFAHGCLTSVGFVSRDQSAPAQRFELRSASKQEHRAQMRSDVRSRTQALLREFLRVNRSVIGQIADSPPMRPANNPAPHRTPACPVGSLRSDFAAGRWSFLPSHSERSPFQRFDTMSRTTRIARRS